jgi:hypothetical protein
VNVSAEWLPIYLSALYSGLLSLVISHIYHRVSLNSAERHLEQMERMTNHHAEQLLVLRTALLAIEKNSGLEAARHEEGKLTGGLHHDGQFIAAPDVSASAVENALPSPRKPSDPTPNNAV